MSRKSVHIKGESGHAICGMRPRTGDSRGNYARDVHSVDLVEISPMFPAALGLYSNLCTRCHRKFKKDNGLD